MPGRVLHVPGGRRDRGAGGSADAAFRPRPSTGSSSTSSAERYRGTHPIAWGRQLQELWLVAGLYTGVLGIGALADGHEADRAVV